MTKNKFLWISVDVESDGPCPALYSMVSFGAVVVEPNLNRTFYGETAPISEDYIPEALAVSGISRSQHERFPEPRKTMLEFSNWLDSLKADRFVFVTDNACLKYSTRVIVDESFAFLKSYKKRNNTVEIYDLVKNKVNLPIPTFNFETNQIEYKRIIGWIENEAKPSWVKVSTELNDSNYPSYTLDHLIFSKRDGWKQAKDLVPGDVVLQMGISPNDDQKQMLIGSLLGDASLNRQEKRGRSWLCGHSLPDLTQFKYDILEPLISGSGIRESVNNRGFSRADGKLFSIHTKTLRFLKDINKKEPASLIDFLDYRGLAVWFADDGSTCKGSSGNPVVRIHTEGFGEDDNMLIAKALTKKTNLEWRVIKAGKGYFLVTLSSKDSLTFLERISPFLPKAVAYKLHNNFESNLATYVWDSTARYDIYDSTVTRVDIINNDESRDYRRKNYCLVVEGNHNFFTTTGLVHNCFDWQFINYYMHRYLMANPFGFSGRRINDIYSGLVGSGFSQNEWKRLYRRTAHTHHPVDDAKGNAEALLAFREKLNFKF